MFIAQSVNNKSNKENQKTSCKKELNLSDKETV
jgi:hypothetical protein